MRTPLGHLRAIVVKYAKPINLILLALGLPTMDIIYIISPPSENHKAK